jgi:hypothetical protein
MSEGTRSRPGGLTALAVINFVFGGWGVIGIMMILFFIGLLSMAGAELQREIDKDPNLKKQMAEMPGVGFLFLVVAINAVEVVLLIISGVGYLKQKRFLGRTLGNVYAGLALLGFALVLAMWPSSFGIGSLVGLIYPILTLILLNFTFKDDFINP